jgi:hypothetical protein
MCQRPHEGWMACAVDVQALARAVLPALQERWRRCHEAWVGALELAVDDQVLAFEVSAAGVRLMECRSVEARRIALSCPVFVQLLFGYRPVAWAAGQPDQRIPEDLVPILSVLFPSGRIWIAPSDGC